MTELITAKVFKQADTSLGMVLKGDRSGNTIIKEIDYHGLLGTSGFQPGMKIVGVNGINCEALAKHLVVDMIRKTEGTLTLVAAKIKSSRSTFTVMKSSKNEALGLGLVTSDSDPGVIIVDTVKKGGLFSGTGLRPGLKLVSINGVQIAGYAMRDVLLLFSEAVGQITIETENLRFPVRIKDKAPGAKEFTAMKAFKGEKVGLSLRDSNSSTGVVIVSSVKAGGKFAKTNIRPGMEILSINGVATTGYSANDMMLLISEAVGEVTIEAKEGPPQKFQESSPVGVQVDRAVNATPVYAIPVDATPVPIPVTPVPASTAVAPYMPMPVAVVQPPPGVRAGGVWGTSKYIGEKTFAICCITTLIGGLCSAFVLCCPMDERDTYAIENKVYDASGKFLGLLNKGYSFQARMPGFQ